VKIKNVDIYVFLLIITSGFMGYFANDFVYMSLAGIGYRIFIDIIGTAINVLAVLKLAKCIKHEAE
jgi:hypothetical protein